MESDVLTGVAAPLQLLGRRLIARSFVVLPDRYPTPDLAWAAARRVVAVAAAEDELCRRLSPLEVVAEYRMPSPGAVQRGFQVLHLDFGVPLGRAVGADIARYTVLHLDAVAPGSGAATRIVALADLARQRRWPGAQLIATRLQSRVDDPDLSEGVFARIVEAADASTELPAKTSAAFLCGLEFDSVEDEQSYLADHGLDVAAVEQRVVLQPGQTLLFDNLRCVHGRLGLRRTEELHQLCLGFTSLPPAEQQAVLLHTLSRLTGVA